VSRRVASQPGTRDIASIGLESIGPIAIGRITRFRSERASETSRRSHRVSILQRRPTSQRKGAFNARRRAWRFLPLTGLPSAAGTARVQHDRRTLDYNGSARTASATGTRHAIARVRFASGRVSRRAPASTTVPLYVRARASRAANCRFLPGPNSGLKLPDVAPRQPADFESLRVGRETYSGSLLLPFLPFSFSRPFPNGA
jgi:hypothetical protein